MWKGGSDADLALVAQQGGLAPGTNGGTFATFTSLGLSDSGGAVLLATLNASTTPLINAANNTGVWEGNAPEDLHLLMRIGDSVGGKTIIAVSFLPTETYVNGQTRSFNSSSGDIVGTATFSDQTTGIVKVIGGTQQLVVVSGTAADGINGATYAGFGSSVINTQIHIALGAKLVVGVGRVTAGNDLGIWAHDSVSDRHLIARTGSGVAPGTTASFLSFSDPVYNNNDAIASVRRLPWLPAKPLRQRPRAFGVIAPARWPSWRRRASPRHPVVPLARPS